MPALIITSPDGSRRPEYLLESELRIGSARHNQCPLPEGDVAEYACVVTDEGGVWMVEDKTGAYLKVNGRRASKVELLNGDSFVVGPYTLTFDREAKPGRKPTNIPAHRLGATKGMEPEDPIPPGSKARLTLQGVPGAEPVYLDHDPVWIGRDAAQCKIPVKDAAVSATHCKVERVDSKFYVVDYNSKNGTKVGRKTVPQTSARFEIVHGEKIYLGKTVILFEVIPFDPDRDGPPMFQYIVGDSAPMRKMYEQIKSYAYEKDLVLITGDTGTGKELVARAIHNLSNRKTAGKEAGDDPNYFAVNCAAVPRDLYEASFFGHEKGAFTGAHADKKGFFEQMATGTLVLDEVGEIPLDLQAKFLRVLQYGDFLRVGGTVPIINTARIIACTNRDLAKMVKEGTFRDDLHSRLDVLTIKIPPLKDRPEDIAALVKHFLGVSGKGVNQQAYLRLCAHDWPCNVRDLKNVLARAVHAAGDSRVIRAEHLDLPPKGKADEEVRDAVYEAKGTADDLLKRYTMEVLKQTGGHQEKTAKAMGIGLTTLKRWLKKWDLNPENFKGQP